MSLQLQGGRGSSTMVQCSEAPLFRTVLHRGQVRNDLPVTEAMVHCHTNCSELAGDPTGVFGLIEKSFVDRFSFIF